MVVEALDCENSVKRAINKRVEIFRMNGNVPDKLRIIRHSLYWAKTALS